MSRPRVLVTAPFRGPGLDKLREIAEVVYDPWIEHEPLRIYDAESLAARIESEGATVVICEADSCKGAVLDLPLVAIGSARGDPTNVDVAGATAKGIPVLRAPGRNADAVAELTVALLLAVNRHVVRADHDVRAGEVFSGGTIPYQRFRAWQVAGRTAGLIGFGAVGRATAWRLQGLGMRVLAHDPFATTTSRADGDPVALVETLDALLAESNVVSMHAAVTPDSAGMIGPREFAAMPDGAIYLNTARAALHDTEALVDALKSGHLGGAGLDHFEGEILPTDHALVGMDNVVLTPHIGGASYDTEANHSALLADDLARLLAGERPINIANPEVLDR